MASPACEERQRLSRKVVDAINAVHALKEQSSDAPNDPSLRILLDQARMAEREAEQELWDHVHLHHCPEVRVAVSQVA